MANDVSAPGIGFDADDNAVTVMFADGSRADIPRASKRAVADQLWGLFASRLPAPGDAQREGQGKKKDARRSGDA